MSVLILPRRFKSQPQVFAPVDKGAAQASGLVSALVFDNAKTLIDRATGKQYTVTNGALQADKPGRVVSLGGTGYVNTGDQTIGGVNLFADSSSQWSVVIYARLANSSITGTFIGKAGATTASRTFHLYRDVSAPTHDPGVWVRGASTDVNWDWNTADWHQYTITWNGSSARIYGDLDKERDLNVGGAAQEAENIVVGARTGGTGAYLTGSVAYCYFFNRAISRQESIELYSNPWQILKAPARRLWVATSGGTTHDLTATNADQVNAASAGAITQAHVLAGSASSQDNTSSAAAITQSHVLAGANSSQANTASAASITQTHVLVADSATQGNTASAGAISQGVVHDLTASNSSQANSASAGAITQAHVLVSAPSVQDNIAAASAIVQAHVLAGSVSVQNNLASTGGILLGDVVISSTVERTAVFRSTISRQTAFQRSKTVIIRFN